ncbi:MAG: hypothetical protein SVS15_01700 [Thermodesulfobacteriota bacterium]|nr:hypothetical protein [Thermodesulfobacteriota bacterium]
MERYIEANPQLFVKRWVSYIDLLGFSKIVQDKDWVYAFSYYTRAIEQFIRRRGFENEVSRTWFSDTFIIYSNTEESFAAIESTTRWFIFFLIRAHMPVRGAMSYGDFYADGEKNVFFGKALIEAYSYGENQDWIGFILCPSAIKQMDVIGFPANKMLHYSYWDVPYKRKDIYLTPKLPAYIIGNQVQEVNGRNACLEKLEEMKSRQSDGRIVQKYVNSIEFIKKNERKVPLKPQNLC